MRAFALRVFKIFHHASVCVDSDCQRYCQLLQQPLLLLTVSQQPPFLLLLPTTLYSVNSLC